MASRKRSRRFNSSLHSRRRYIRPFLENLEYRLVLSSATHPVVVANNTSLAAPGAASRLAPDIGLVPVPLVHGGTSWLYTPGALGLQPRASSGSPHGTTAPSRQPTVLNTGAILGHLPVASPFQSITPLQSPGPPGYITRQIQT